MKFANVWLLLLFFVPVQYSCYKDTSMKDYVSPLIDEFIVDSYLDSNGEIIFSEADTLPNEHNILLVFRKDFTLGGHFTFVSFNEDSFFDVNTNRELKLHINHTNGAPKNAWESYFYNTYPEICYYEVVSQNTINLLYNDCSRAMVLKRV